MLPAPGPDDIRPVHPVSPLHLPGVHARCRRRPPMRGVRQRGRSRCAPAANAVRRTMGFDDPGGHLRVDRDQRAAFVAQMASSRVESDLVMWSPAVANGELYRLITSAFLHNGITHILFNMFALFVVGPPLEIWLGRLRFGALYVLSALGGSVLVYLLAPLDAATEGASGAVFGLFAATFVVAQKGQRRRPLGRHHDRDQPGHHVHRAVDQLAGTPWRTGDRRADRAGLRVRARQAQNPGAGGRDGWHASCCSPF